MQTPIGWERGGVRAQCAHFRSGSSTGCAFGRDRRPAEWNSAIEQSGTLRYEPGDPVSKSRVRLQAADGHRRTGVPPAPNEAGRRHASGPLAMDHATGVDSFLCGFPDRRDGRPTRDRRDGSFEPRTHVRGHARVRGHRSGWARLGLCLVLLGAALGQRTRGAETVLAFAEYQNRVSVSNSGPQAAAVAFFGGFVTNGPANGQVGLGMAAFGQPVEGGFFTKPDFLLGQEIVCSPPAAVTNAPTIEPSEKAFYVANANKVFASEPGYVNIVWPTTTGLLTNRFLISSLGLDPAVAIYWTDFSGTNTGAPAVNASNVTVVPHYNSTIKSTHFWVAQDQMHAQGAVGRIVLEYQSRPGGQFAGLEIVEVREYQPDVAATDYDIGAWLQPKEALTNRLKPFVSRGLTSTASPYVYQHSAPGETNDGWVFAVRPTSSEDQIELFWMKPGLSNVVWPYEMHRYTADWPGNFSDLAQRVYWTEDDFGGRTRAPTVSFSNVPNVTLYYNTDIPGTNQLWLGAGRALHARSGVGRILLHYNQRSLQFLEVRRDDVPDYTPAVDVGVFLASSGAIANPGRPYASDQLTGDAMHFVYQHNLAGDTNYDGKLFLARPATVVDRVEIFWTQIGPSNVVWPCEMDRYSATWPSNFTQVCRRIYHTQLLGGTPTKAPPVDISGGAAPNVVIHYNPEIPPGSSNLWLQSNPRQLQARQYIGPVLIHYDRAPSPGIIGVEYVQVLAYVPDYVDDWRVGGRPPWYVGDRLLPEVDYGGPATDTHVAQGGPPVSPPYVYQHQPPGNMTSPMSGQIFAVRETTANDQIEIFWRRRGLQDVVWPYEMHRYTTRWPTNEESKYQRYVRGTAPLGPGVDVPSWLNATLGQYQSPAGHASLAGNRFTSTQPGWSLLQFLPGNNVTNIVLFQVVRSVAHDDTTFFDLSLHPWVIGTEITDPSHQGSLPGYVYVPTANPHPWDRYDWEIYDGNTNDPPELRTQQIFGVNQGAQEIWWYTNNQTVAWPWLVKRYTNTWPDDPGLNVIVIASQKGSPAVDPVRQVNYRLYYQNDPDLPGFNPNDEHAYFDDNGEQGQAVFALRDDLGTGTTSDPWVLLKYQDPSDQDPSGRSRWRFGVFKVMATGRSWDGLTHTFNYGGTAATLVQAPRPLSTLDVPPNPKSTFVSGPGWRDRKGYYWAKAAGDDGGAANIVMRYFYPVKDGFYFPSNYFASFPADVTPTNLPPAKSLFPWLDVRAGTPGTPHDITYQVQWPQNPGVNPGLLSVGATLFKRNNGCPDIQGQTSVEVIYEQAFTTGGVHSVKLIDPTRAIEVPLAQVPSDAQTVLDGTRRYFTQLAPQLRSRFYYDTITHHLGFQGQFVPTTAGIEEKFGYLLVNVITAPESNRLVNLSTDGNYRTAVRNLCRAAAQAVEAPPDGPNDSLALTAGLAKGQGYVTVALGNSAILTTNNPAESVLLNVILVTCPTYRGEIEVINSENPFDEKLTLRHSGDFAGKADDYIFEWRTLPPVQGLPPTADWTTWNSFVPLSQGQGVLDITIEGPGLFTLSDNYFMCRYKPKANPLCLPGADPTDPVGWSEWTRPQLAEGWIKRVLNAVNPFEQRFTNYMVTTNNTIVSMVSQAGARWIGNVPLNAQSANGAGLIEIYETVLKHGRELSVDGSPPVAYGPANDALLLAAGRISDLYMLLGNEAYADATDPTIAFGTDDHQYGSVASSLHCFMNQTASLLDEELALLRGRDDRLQPPVQAYPYYNRLVWNYTHGINGGEVAYSLNYGVYDVNKDGAINEDDAKALYPQGHGDAWGHYLTAIKNYYRLLQNSNFTWVPRIEAVLVGGLPVSVDYLDERNFAKAAAARARTGGEIVNLTYRQAYVEDPGGQWQGYQDANTNRAWGLSEWAGRAGQGAFFDWVVGNALLPDKDPTLTDEDPGNDHTGIQIIDRTTVMELRDIASAAHQIQAQLDNADQGLNPLGLAKNAIPFDIDPAAVSQGKTHFEQIFERAVSAMNNAITVFDHANNATQLLRRQADSVTDFQQKVVERENDFTSRLIEIFGYPYPEDIGPTGSYPSGYEGPDLEALHFNYIDAADITGVASPRARVVSQPLVLLQIPGDGGVVPQTNTVAFSLSSEGLTFVKPAGWTQRRAPGEIQRTLTELLQAQVRFSKALRDYDNLVNQIEDQAKLLQMQYGVNAQEIALLNQGRATQQDLNSQITLYRGLQLDLRAAQRIAPLVQGAIAECLPKAVGLATDATAPARGALQMVGAVLSEVANSAADALSMAELGAQQAKEEAQAANNIELTTLRQVQGIANQIAQLRQLVRQEATMRYELYTLKEAITQAAGGYQSTLARGQRLVEERVRFRQQTAAQVQSYRYKDMAFRIFRDDAIQKYRAQFDLAARYVYLAAKAYDYETCLLPGDSRGCGRDFLTDLVRCRAIGLIQNGQPVVGSGTGDPGLADPLARMFNNWNLVIKSQLGFNNPETETGRFSLRSELFRVQTNANSTVAKQVWRDILSRSVVSNLWDVSEFQQYCIFFSTNQAVAEPAIVLPFATTVTFGQNYFGWPLGGGDSAYDSTHFATKIRSVGVWFANYNGLAMSSTPRVYLFPVGADVLRAPTGNLGQTREWTIMDQLLPVPYVNPSALNDPTWIPINVMLGGNLGEIRRFASFRAYHDSGNFNPAETISSSRLIGRSVWNTKWLLIIPAGTLLQDRNEALQRFINGSLVGGVRDGNGISDIKIFFQTYSYAGNKKK
jgi:hypothetical protein